MEAIIPILMSLLGSAVPALSSTTVAGTIVSGIIQLAPIVIKEAPQFISKMKELINTVKGSGLINDDQLKQLQASEALLDAAFETNAKKAEDEDAAE